MLTNHDQNRREYAKIVISNYDPAWKQMYDECRAQITAAISGYVRGIEHIGSTAVVGLSAKPVIDIMMALTHFPDDIDRVIAPLDAIGFEYVPKPEHEGFFFRRGPWGNGTHHLHVVEYGGRDWTRQTLFRDYLLTHPGTTQAYGALKRQLASTFGADRVRYTQAKTTFVESVLSEALVRMKALDNL